jgi:Zn/Cd-binding protein ZinT
MAGKLEFEMLMRGLQLEEFLMIRPGMTVQTDMLAVFTYSKVHSGYITVAYSSEWQAFQVYRLTKRMEDDIDSKRRLARKNVIQESGLFNSKEIE